MSAVAMPDWVAPEGKVRDDLKLGDLVRFEAILSDAGVNREGPHDWCGWSRHERVIGQGIITGLRFVYSGRITEQTEYVGADALEPPDVYKVRTRERTHRAYLVCLNIHHKPVHVLSDDVVKVATLAYAVRDRWDYCHRQFFRRESDAVEWIADHDVHDFGLCPVQIEVW